MYPWRYVKKTMLKGRGSRESGFYLANIFGVVSFLLISMIIAPIFHELMHLIVLEFYQCPYGFNIEFTQYSGIHGTIDPFCNLSKGRRVLVFSAGILGNFTIAAVLFMLVSILHRRGILIHSNFLMYIALGFLSDSLFYFFANEGDIINILKTLGREDWVPLIPLLGIAVFSFSVIYLYLYIRSFLEEFLRAETEIRGVKEFLNEINH